MNPYLKFGLAGESVAWMALLVSAFGFGFALALGRLRGLVGTHKSETWVCLLVLAGAGALLSWGYLVHYLRGGPRIVDATYYYLQARTFSLFQFSFQVPDPVASFNGRFLLQTPDGALAVLFPPGYAAALAFGFWLGAPLAIGPLTSALLVFSTYWMARELHAPRSAALGAAALGVLCAALRYHTADTMSHGWAALLATLTVAASARASGLSLWLAGFSGGWLIATRPVTGVVTLLGALFLARDAGIQRIKLLVAIAPGVLLLLLQQRSATGHWLASTQLEYYSVADGPPGCFRFGFGLGIGCQFEHGDFVRSRLADGYGLGEALGNTLRRLGVHALDIGNAAPLSALVPYGAWIARRERAARIALGVVLGVVVAYAPFYFEASYPGGGARLFADLLPIEHVFAAWALASLGWMRFAWPLSVLGFALHTHRQHAALRDREGGQPMFEQRVLDEAGVKRGLVLVSTDHGFALGHDPAKRNARDGVLVARRRGDALDRLLWERLGRPRTFLYFYDAAAAGSLGGVRPVDLGFQAPDRIEAENLWPPYGVPSGWVHPDFLSMPCVSKGRGLRLHDARVVLRLPRTDRPTYLTIGWAGGEAHPKQTPLLEIDRIFGESAIRWVRDSGGCSRSESIGPLPAGAPPEFMLQGSGLLDYIELSHGARKGVDN